MHFIHSWFSVWVLLAAAGAAADVNLSELISSIPDCALQCILSGFAQSSDALSDPEITCRNVTLQASLSACVQGQCNYTEQAEVGILNGKLCHDVPIDNSRVWAVTIVGLVCGPLALLAIALRTYSRYSTAKKLGLDDWLMLFSGATLCALLALDIENGFVNGFGRHYWNINPYHVVLLLKIFYVAEVLYILAITLVKASILLFYRRVFPKRWFRIADLFVLGLVIAAGIAIVIPIIFQCTPVSGVWDRSIESKCININVLAYATGGIAVGLDIIILALPIPELINLNMNRRKKFHVIFMFSLGSFACITSIIRLKYLVAFATSKDGTWDNALPAVWSLLEICIAIICACLPAMRALFTRWLPRIFNIDTIAYHKDSGRNKNSYADQIHSQSEKMGPSYNKRAVETPDQGLLDKIGSKGGRTETRVWVNPKFDNHGNVLGDEMSRTESHVASSKSTSVFALEGPRESDNEDLGMIERGLGIQMRDFGSVALQNDNKVHIETTTIHSISPPNTSKKLPPIPTHD